MARWELWVRDRLRRRTHRIDVYERFEATPNLNDAGVWQLFVPIMTPAAEALREPRAGVILTRDGRIVMSGPAVWHGRTETAGGPDGRTLEVKGIDDTGQLARRTIRPDPGGPPITTDADVRTGAAETLLHQYVSYHAANNAPAWRNVEGLSVGTDSGRGTVSTKSYGRTNLLDALREIAAPDGLIFEVVQIEGEFQFQTRMSRDLRGSVVFSVSKRTLESATVGESVPEANYVYVVGKDRTVVEHGDATSIARYGLIEAFVNQTNTDDETALLVKAREELANHAGAFAVEVSALDSAGLAAFEDYALGDRVSVVLSDEEIVTGYVSSFRIGFSGRSAPTIKPTVTTVPLRAVSRTSRSGIDRRVIFLEEATDVYALGARLDTVEATLADLQDAGITAAMLAAGAAATNIGNGGVTAAMLASGAALSNLGFTPSRMYQGQYTGNGAATQDITAPGFQPKFVWVYLAGTGVGIYPANQDNSIQLILSNEVNDGNQITMLSNGFQATLGLNNANGEVYVYTAWG